MRTAAAALLLLASLLAGCQGGSGPGPSPSTSTGPSHAFDGAAALAFVKSFALEGNDTPRYRIPGTAGQAEGAAMLWDATAVPGWTRTWQNLTGRDYVGLDRSIVAGYTAPGPYDGPGQRRGCTQAEHDAVPDLPFSNLFAVLPSSTAGAPLLVLGAHWDSQMHADNDPDHSKRDLPDAGADDGASGVGVLFQLMRELQGKSLPVSVGVLLLDGEDGFYDCYPLAGSLWFAAHPVQPLAAFVLLDMVGDPAAVYAREGYSMQQSPKLVDLVWRHGQALDGGKHFTNGTVSIEDDHRAFQQKGIRAVDLIDAGRTDTVYGFPPQWDTSFDTVDRLDAGMLSLVGDTLLATLQDPGLPAAIA